MKPIRIQRRDNVRKIVDLAMFFYSGKNEADKQEMLKAYAESLADKCTLKQQAEWINQLERQKNRLEKHE